MRVDEKNNLQNARPCALCLIQLRQLPIRRIFYSNAQGAIMMEYLKNMEITYMTKACRNAVSENIPSYSKYKICGKALVPAYVLAHAVES